MQHDSFRVQREIDALLHAPSDKSAIAQEFATAVIQRAEELSAHSALNYTMYLDDAMREVLDEWESDATILA